LWVLVDRVHEVIALYGYNSGGAVMTLVLPLGLFIVVMIALYFVFSRPHRVPGRRPITGARPVAPAGNQAPSIAAATGFPTATSMGATEPLADRATPSAEVACTGDTAVASAQAADEGGAGTGDTASGEPTATRNPEETE
jgi:hypothetical protein